MKHNKRYTMYCPVCNRGKIFDAVDRIAARKIRLLGPQDASQATYFTKCWACGRQIGVAFQTAGEAL